MTRMTSHLLLFAALSLAAFVFLLWPNASKMLLRPVSNHILYEESQEGLLVSGDSIKIALFSGETTLNDLRTLLNRWQICISASAMVICLMLIGARRR